MKIGILVIFLFLLSAMGWFFYDQFIKIPTNRCGICNGYTKIIYTTGIGIGIPNLFYSIYGVIFPLGPTMCPAICANELKIQRIIPVDLIALLGVSLIVGVYLLPKKKK
jgi:hypothetical protein